MRAIAQWVRAATKMEADYRASSSHGANLEHQLRRVQALADQRGQQLAESRAAVRAAEDAAAHAAAESEKVQKLAAASDLRHRGEKDRRGSVEAAMGQAKQAEKRVRMTWRNAALSRVLSKGEAVPFCALSTHGSCMQRSNLLAADTMHLLLLLRTSRTMRDCSAICWVASSIQTARTRRPLRARASHQEASRAHRSRVEGMMALRSSAAVSSATPSAVCSLRLALGGSRGASSAGGVGCVKSTRSATRRTRMTRTR